MIAETNNWELMTYDLWPDADDGYYVNLAFHSGRVYHIDDWENDIAVLTVLRDGEGYDIDVNDPDFDVDGDEHVLYITYKGSPLCELQRTDKPVTEGTVQ